MSDISPTAPEPEQQDTEPIAAAPRKGRALPLVSALVALVVGAGATFGGLYLAGWRSVPEHEFNVLVFLKDDATQQQKDSVRQVLESLPRKGDVRLRTKDEAFAEMQEVYKGSDVLDGLKADSLPESYLVTTVSREFDCNPLRPLVDTKAVQKLSVVRPSKKSGEAGQQILC